MTVPSSITIEEAVTLMVNMDNIPAGYSLLEILSYLEEEGEVEYENAIIDALPEAEIKKLQLRYEYRANRYATAKYLFKQMDIDLEANEILKKSEEHLSGARRLTLDSLIEWASTKHDIFINLYKEPTHDKRPILIDTNKQLKVRKLNNVYRLLAPLLEAYLEYMGSNNFKKNGTWDFSLIATHLQRINDPNNPIYNNTYLNLTVEHSDLLHEKVDSKHQTMRKLVSDVFNAKEKI